MMTKFPVLVLWAAIAPTSPAQVFTTLYSFDYADGAQPNALTQAGNGGLYGAGLLQLLRMEIFMEQPNWAAPATAEQSSKLPRVER